MTGGSAAREGRGAKFLACAQERARGKSPDEPGGTLLNCAALLVCQRASVLSLHRQLQLAINHRPPSAALFSTTT